MSSSFWLGTWDVVPRELPTGSMAEPLVADGADALAIEVVRVDGDLAVLISAVDDVGKPDRLQCRVAFTNAPDACNAWRDRGFPLVDAAIEYDGRRLEVRTPLFSGAPGMRYEDPLLVVDGIVFEAAADDTEVLTAPYAQVQQSPDSAWPATYVRRLGVTWRPPRSRVSRLKVAEVDVQLELARCPNLRPLKKGALAIARAWSGELGRPPDASVSPIPPKRTPRADTFGVPAFRFDDVEVIGFRIEIEKTPDLDRKLARLIAPLNFHLARTGPEFAIPDFRYRTATRTVLVELLRYGRMRLQKQGPPLTVQDYQSQHELVVRVLVGRVDDDTAQAQDPAIYVPAICVDNPWSKVLGRDVQGFDKRMAEFCVLDHGGWVPLRPDGRAPGEMKPRPLAQVSQIRMVAQTGAKQPAANAPLVEFDFRPERSPNWDDFRNVDLGLALSTLSLVDTRWRQMDFDLSEFRRSFARAAMRRAQKGFRSVQVTPVGDRLLDKAWINGEFTVDRDVRMVVPTGGATAKFHHAVGLPDGWNALCDLLRVPLGGSRTLSFQTGSWHRLRFAMDMTVDDGLEWTA
jgi:hypothetical protein